MSEQDVVSADAGEGMVEWEYRGSVKLHDPKTGARVAVDVWGTVTGPADPAEIAEHAHDFLGCDMSK